MLETRKCDAPKITLAFCGKWRNTQNPLHSSLITRCYIFMVDDSPGWVGLVALCVLGSTCISVHSWLIVWSFVLVYEVPSSTVVEREMFTICGILFEIFTKNFADYSVPIMALVIEWCWKTFGALHNLDEPRREWAPRTMQLG